MKEFDLLQSLLPYISDYQKENESKDVNDFSNWLTKKIKGKPTKKPEIGGVLPEIMHSIPDLSNDFFIVNQLRYLFKYSTFYTKKALEGTNLKTINDIAFLATLLIEKDLTKSELISRHLTEITSGTEVIKRLNKLGLLNDYKSKDDKRSKKVHLTEVGRDLITEIMFEMNKVAQIITSGLKKNEKDDLLEILTKMREYHDNIYKKHRKKSIEDIIEATDINSSNNK